MDTLSYYRKIYDPLFKTEDYNHVLFRGKPSLRVFQKYAKERKIKIKQVVDIGCSWGKCLEYWKTKNIEAWGVDVSPTVVNYCIKRKKLQCVLASATNLPMFNDSQFDLYMASDVYEHLREDDLSHAISEAKRITKKYFVIRPHPVIDMRKKLHLTVWTLEKWEQFFISHGLKIKKIGENGESTYKNVFLMTI